VLVNLLSYEAPYFGPEGGRPGIPTQAVRHKCAGKLGIFKIFQIAPHRKKSIVKKCLAGRWIPPPWTTGPCAQAHLSTMVNPALEG
jgi:hypothetical protein